MTPSIFLVAFLFAPLDGELIKNFNPAEFEKFIASDLKANFKKHEAGENIVYTIEGRPFTALFNPRRKFVLFQSRTSGVAALKDLNAWNEGAPYSRVYQDDNTVVLEGAASFATGISRAALANLYQNLSEELTRFNKAVPIRRAVQER